MNSEALPEKEVKKRQRERLIIAVSGVSLLFITVLEAQISKISLKVPLSSNILVFGFINLNIVLLLILMFLVIRNVGKVIFERRRRVIWSRLRSKLIMAFIGFAFFPTVVLFFVAAGFISHSITSWFSPQIKTSLRESREVAQTYYENSAINAVNYAQQISGNVTGKALLEPEMADLLKDFVSLKQREYNLGLVEVFSLRQKEQFAVFNPKVPSGSLTDPASDFVKEGLSGKTLTKIQSLGKGDLIRGIVPVRSAKDEKAIEGAVVVSYYVPRSLTGKIAEIEDGYNKYLEQTALMPYIKWSYLLILLLIALLIAFSATWFGLYLSRGITVPLQRLAEGTKQIAQGNLNVRIEAQQDDEIGSLVASFNTMAEDIKMSETRLRQAMDSLEERRRYMEIILRDIGAGVISVDSEGRVRSINTSAEKKLNIRTDRVLEKMYHEVLRPDYRAIVDKLVAGLRRSGKDTISEEVKVPTDEGTITLLVSLTALRDEKGKDLGMVAVFEDLTQLIKAQRVEAWREVARRIAHEIKNPLTPIQLSAQRLRKKYMDTLNGDPTVFDECTRTIIRQVEELKGMVNEFSNFARLPAANPTPNSLNEVLKEAFLLFQQGHRHIDLRFDPDDSIPVFELDKEQVKRAAINLLDNAVAAVQSLGNGEGEVLLKTTYDQELKIAMFEVVDNGCGVSPEDKPRLFEPYFSTKRAGTGLGLTIVSQIVRDHNGFIRIQDNHPRGARFIVELPVRTAG